MEGIRVHAHGKINWALKVMGKRPDGYHELDTLFQSIALYDELILRPAQEDSFYCKAAYVPGDGSNLAMKALAALRQEAFVPPVSISLEKHIPVAGGLAGGSADAAGVIAGCNALFGLGLSPEKLREVGLKVGADVPFCLMGGAARATGVGEVLTPINATLPVSLVLLNPGRGLSTPRIFQALDHSLLDGKNLDAALAAFTAGDIPAFTAQMANDLYPPAAKLCPDVTKLINRLKKAGALAAAMSGSGPTVFALFPDEAAARAALAKCKAPVGLVTSPWHQGIDILPL